VGAREIRRVGAREGRRVGTLDGVAEGYELGPDVGDSVAILPVLGHLYVAFLLLLSSLIRTPQQYILLFDEQIDSGMTRPANLSTNKSKFQELTLISSVTLATTSNGCANRSRVPHTSTVHPTPLRSRHLLGIMTSKGITLNSVKEYP
jgi:hypothetical protein